MVNIEKLNEMLNMQKALDSKIMREKKLDYINWCDLRRALLDEIGELNHELKPTWCWWKDTVGEVNRERALEELVDCVHFSLCAYYTHYSVRKPITDREVTHYHFEANESLDTLMLRALYKMEDSIFYVLLIGEKLGFSFNEIYDEYIAKNKVNYERLANHY